MEINRDLQHHSHIQSHHIRDVNRFRPNRAEIFQAKKLTGLIGLTRRFSGSVLSGLRPFG